jgi:putative ABC transport system permease protein
VVAPAAELRRALAQLAPLAAEALEQLRGEWRGHALTLAGIVWGAASVILLLSLGAGFTRFLDLGLDKTGDRWVAVFGGYTTSELGGRRPGRIIELEDEDIGRLRAGVPDAGAVAAENQYMLAVSTPNRTRATVVSAGDAELLEIQNHRIARGRYLEAADEREGRRVAVLGAELVEIFFGSADPLGRTLQIQGTPFEVVGVLERKGFQLFTHMDIHDRMIFVPHVVGRRAVGDARSVETIYLDLRRIDDEAAVRAEARAVLWPRHRLADADDEAIRMMSVPEVSEPMRNIFVALTALLGAIGTGTLAMAGVGVANLMIAIANERRRELAMRRACGARRADVVFQLLGETVVIVVAGGGVGVLLGIALCGVLALLPLPEMVPTPIVSPAVLATAFAVLVATGLAAGVLPARIASRVDPAAALRVI